MAVRVVKHIDTGTGLGKAEMEGADLHELTSDSILVCSEPPSGFYKIYGIYLKKVGNKYFIRYVINNEPEK